MSDPTPVALAAALAFACVAAGGAGAIRVLRLFGAGERTDKKDAPVLAHRHAEKRDTPTMGGLLLIGAALVAVAVFGRPLELRTGILLLTLLGFGAIGFVDDLIKIRHPVKKGLSKRAKSVAMGALALLASSVLYADAAADGGAALVLPGAGAVLSLGPFYVLLAAFVVVGTANAVNFTDGLDGLASGLLALAFGAFALLAHVAGDAVLADRHAVAFVRGGAGAAVVAGALGGGTLGFLVWNRHPARLFMGDTGALALGAALGLLAVTIRMELLLVVVGGVFVAEALSVVVQVIAYHRYRRRVFRCAPLHHHFEYCGWPETKITRRFWAAGALLTIGGVWMTLGV